MVGGGGGGEGGGGGGGGGGRKRRGSGERGGGFCLWWPVERGRDNTSLCWRLWLEVPSSLSLSLSLSIRLHSLSCCRPVRVTSPGLCLRLPWATKHTDVPVLPTQPPLSAEEFFSRVSACQAFPNKVHSKRLWPVRRNDHMFNQTTMHLSKVALLVLCFSENTCTTRLPVKHFPPKMWDGASDSPLTHLIKLGKGGERGLVRLTCYPFFFSP